MSQGTAETMTFVLRWLPAGASVLEVGYGEGELASELQNRGFRVLAIDSDSATVTAAQARGVEVAMGQWQDLVPPSCDAVLFTRSIHHISPFDAAIDLARRTAPMIVIEDFALQDASLELAAWLRSELASDRPGLGTARRPSVRRDPPQVALGFRIEREESAPYCYRYFEPLDDRRIYDESQRILRTEETVLLAWPLREYISSLYV